MSCDEYKFGKRALCGATAARLIKYARAFMNNLNNLPLDMLYSNLERAPWTGRRNQLPRRRWPGLLLLAATLALNLTSGEVRGEDPDDYLTREGKRSLIDPEHKSLYERKLFVTPDEVARYVFLTNAPNDGDRSAAVFRAPKKKGSLPGNYWVTATVASGSLGIEDTRRIAVRRYDAPLPVSTTKAVHELWLAMLERSRAEVLAPSSPTGIFSAKSARGVRINAITVRLEQHFRCWALMRIGESLIEYPKTRESKRVEAARKIEEESYRLLKRVTQTR